MGLWVPARDEGNSLQELLDFNFIFERQNSVCRLYGAKRPLTWITGDPDWKSQLGDFFLNSWHILSLLCLPTSAFNRSKLRLKDWQAWQHYPLPPLQSLPSITRYPPSPPSPAPLWHISFFYCWKMQETIYLDSASCSQHMSQFSSHITHVNESCHTNKWDMSHIWMSHATHWMSHVTHMDESSHTHEWFKPHK